MAFLDNDGLIYVWSKIKGMFAPKADAVKAITRSGTTFTATRADGTTFTFTQQDSTVDKTTTTPKADGTASIGSETKYAAGDHVHPTDTTRASQADFEDHVDNDTRHITAAERTAWNGKTSNTGTVTSVGTGVGLAGGAITGSGTIKAKLKSETAHTASSATPGNTSGRQYAVGVDKDGYLSVNVPWTDNDTKALGSMTGTLGVGHGGTGVSTLGAGVVYHSASGTGAFSVATAADIVSEIGDTAVNRATADSSGNNIADTYAKKADLAGMYKYKGSVSGASSLPTSGNAVGDVYNIESSSAYGSAGANVAWNGTSWDSLGEIFTITAITNAEIDAICV